MPVVFQMTCHLAFLLCFTAAPPPSMPTNAKAVADYFVSPFGNDGNAGSKLSPWQTIQHALDTAGSGSIIELATGAYGVIGENGNGYLRMPGKTLTLRSDGGLVIVRGRSAAAVKTNGLLYNSADNAGLTVMGIDFELENNTGSEIWSYGFRLDGDGFRLTMINSSFKDQGVTINQGVFDGDHDDPSRVFTFNHFELNLTSTASEKARVCRFNSGTWNSTACNWNTSGAAHPFWFYGTAEVNFSGDSIQARDGDYLQISDISGEVMSIFGTSTVTLDGLTIDAEGQGNLIAAFGNTAALTMRQCDFRAVLNSVLNRQAMVAIWGTVQNVTIEDNVFVLDAGTPAPAKEGGVFGTGRKHAAQTPDSDWWEGSSGDTRIVRNTVTVNQPWGSGIIVGEGANNLVLTDNELTHTVDSSATILLAVGRDHVSGQPGAIVPLTGGFVMARNRCTYSGFGSHGINILLGADDGEVYQNVAINSDFGIVVKGSGNFIHHNAGHQELLIKGGKNNLIEFNSIWITPTATLNTVPLHWNTQDTASPPLQPADNVIRNNVFDASEVKTVGPHYSMRDATDDGIGNYLGAQNQIFDYNGFVLSQSPDGFARIGDGDPFPVVFVSLSELVDKWSIVAGGIPGNDEHSLVTTVSQFVDPANGDFTLIEASPFRGAASNGGNMGMVQDAPAGEN